MELKSSVYIYYYTNYGGIAWLYLEGIWAYLKAFTQPLIHGSWVLVCRDSLLSCDGGDWHRSNNNLFASWGKQTVYLEMQKKLKNKLILCTLTEQMWRDQLTIWVCRQTLEYESVVSEEQCSFSRQQYWASNTTTCSIFSPIRKQVNPQAFIHYFFTRH